VRHVFSEKIQAEWTLSWVFQKYFKFCTHARNT